MKWKKFIAVFTAAGCLAGTAPIQAFAASSAEIMDQIESYMADLEASQLESEELENEIASKQEEVSALYTEVAALNIERESYYEDMKQRIAYFYEESQGYSLIGALFSSGSFAEFINRIQFQQSLYDYDSARLEEYQDLVNELEEKQAALDAEIDDLGDMVEEQVVLQAALDAAIAVKQTEYDEAVEAEAEAAARAAAEAAAREAAEREAQRRAEEEAAVYALSYETSSGTESSSASTSSETASVSEEASSSSEGTSYSEETSSSSESASPSETVSSEETYSEPEASSSEDTSSSETSSSSDSSSSSGSSGGSYDMPSGSGILTWSGGVNYFNGHMETWYTMREWKGNLGIPGMYIGSDGIVRDCDGYICVASDDDPKGTIVETSLGTGKVYDCGPGHGIIDIYTDWPLY